LFTSHYFNVFYHLNHKKRLPHKCGRQNNQETCRSERIDVEPKDLGTKASLSSALRAAYGGCALYARLRAGVTREVAKIFDF